MTRKMMGWHIVIINNTIVRAGNDLLCIISLQAEDEKKWGNRAQIFTYFAKSKKTALKDCIAHRPGIHISQSLSEETGIYTV